MKTLRLLNLVLIAMVLGLGLSCKKDNEDPVPSNNPNPNGGNGSLIASAEINFQPEDETVQFKIYGKGGVASLMGDTNLVVSFGAQDQYGNDIDALSISFGVVDPSNIQVGKVYTLPYAEPDYMSTAHVKKPGNNPFSVYNAADITLGEVVITSLTNNHIKGTFNFTGYVADMVDPMDPNKKKATVSNGEFDCKLIKM